MKHIYLLLLLFTGLSVFAQDYKQQWVQVQRHEDSLEIKQAADVANEIYHLAKKDKNEQQLLKVFFYRAKYMMVLEEDAQFKVVQSLKDDMKGLSVPAKALMESLYAEILLKIYHKNKYSIDKRADTETMPNDFAEWNGKNFSDAIETAYRNSIMQREVLYKIPLMQFSTIIDLNIEMLETNRSLYDFLAERYITSTYERYGLDEVTKCPAEFLFGSTEDFKKCILNDSTQINMAKKLTLMQEMEGYYIAKKDDMSLKRAMLRRFDLLHGIFYFNNYKTALITSLDDLIKKWGSSPFAFEAKIKLASLHFSDGQNNHKDSYIKAIALCNDIIENASQKSIVVKAKNLKNRIKAYSINLETEKNPDAGKPILAHLRFKNVDTLQVRIYKVKATTTENLISGKDLREKKVHLEKQYIIAGPTDYRYHTTEIMLPALTQGRYAIIVGTPGDTINYITPNLINVAGITAATLVSDKEHIFSVFEKQTGKPVKKALITIEGKKFTTGNDGRVAIPQLKGDFKTLDYTITHKGDILTGNVYEYYNSNTYEEKTAAVTVFTDRSIYRPGQTVYFKAVALLRNNDKIETVPNVYLDMVLEDDESSKIAQLRLKTNEFGSVTGEFTLPQNGITGNYRISVQDEEDFWDDMDVEFKGGYHDFDVEEYKRPTFEVEFEPIKGDIVFNREMTVHGIAKSFSGAPVAYGRVAWRYSRSSHMPVYNNNYYNDEEDDNIGFIQGTATTDAEGKFSIVFTPTADKRYDAKGIPVFTFSIDADVTDANGENQRGHTNIYAGYHTVTLNVIAPATLVNNETAKVVLGATNLNGQERHVKGKIEIYKLTENTKDQKRRWPAPEIQTISRADFEKAFPDLPYEDFKEEHEKLLQSYAVNTATAKEIEVTPKSWMPGKYEIVFTATDSLGKEVKANTAFTINNTEESSKELFSHQVINKDFKKDGRVRIKLRSSKPVMYVNVMAYGRDKLLYDKVIKLQGEKVVDISIKNSAAIVINLTYSFVYKGEFYDIKEKARIPDEKPPLHIESESLTDKLQPGSMQSWKFTVKGNPKLPAEVLASMYDASLDKFTHHKWDALYQPIYYYNSTPDIKNNIYQTSHHYRSLHISPLNEFDAADRLYNFGFDINNAKNIYILRTLKKQIPGGKSFIISGIVSDANTMPVPGVSVRIEGTDEGIQTDFDGRYIIYANKGDYIQFSFVGMKSERVLIEKADANLNLQMTEDTRVLDDIVIQAYRSTTKATSNVASTTVTSTTIEGRPNADFVRTLQGQIPGLNVVSDSGEPGGNSVVVLRGYGSVNGNTEPLFVIDGVPLDGDTFRRLNPNEISSVTLLKDAASTAVYGSRGTNGVVVITTNRANEELKAMQNIKARKDFNETAFFKPQLKTDKDGNIAFEFETPEALTQWKLQLLAHNKEAGYGYTERTFTTSKDLMVVPNMPRFLRENDTIVLVSKITNLTPEDRDGTALLQLFDALTMQPADAAMMNIQSSKPFTVKAKSSTTVTWKIAVPYGMQAVQYKVLAKAGSHTDGEENILPVLSNSMLVTESIPLWVKPNSAKSYTLENLKNSTSNTLRHHGITLEYTSNPAWAALQSLPYLMEYQHNCAEQVFSRYYANVIAAHIVNSNPKIAEVFAEWKKSGKAESKLMQNNELKTALLAETPWILDGLSDAESKNRMALLFEFDKVKNSIALNLKLLEDKQSESGGFPWFDGGTDNEYITRHIVAGLGYLDKLGTAATNLKKTDDILKSAIEFLDGKMAENYKKQKAGSKATVYINRPYNQLHSLYARSYHLKKHPLAGSLIKYAETSVKEIKLNWKQYNLYEKGMAALILHRFGDTLSAKRIITALRETASNNEEWGMYWIENKPGWYWYNAPVETQALLIEAFTEIDSDNTATDAMKVWLLKQKQNKNWPTTKATTEAVYALLMKGTNWLSVKENTVIKSGSKDITAKIAEAGKEAGTGYIKLNWKPAEITKDMATISIENKTAVPGYGGYYWQYFEDIDKMKAAQKGLLDVSREVYRKTITATGSKLEKATQGNPFKIGELLTIRLIIKAGEDMEYVHLKDLRASAFEPVDVMSKYEWKDGLGFYRSTRDAATHFFFDRINKGTYVLEYDVRVNNEGDFSGGVSTIQSMYAPEFTGHSKGERVKTK